MDNLTGYPPGDTYVPSRSCVTIKSISLLWTNELDCINIGIDLPKKKKVDWGAYYIRHATPVAPTSARLPKALPLEY